MLNLDSLQQLKQLKKEIHDSVERVEGVVRGSQGRFGFVRLEDKRDIFLPPPEMQKVFPGDRVRIAIVEQKDGKQAGEIEKLLESPLDTFIGRYVVRGKAHFVEPDILYFNRLLFIPPSERNKAQPGDYIQCRVKRHPIRDGKSLVDIIDTIGSADSPGIEAALTLRKFGLPSEWQESDLEGLVEDQYAAERKDLTHIPFVTIDSPESRDLDDALYAECTNSGWRLMVAIADPSALIAPDSPLERAALARNSSVYMPGKVIPMLPEAISQEHCSLLAGETRPAMVCDIETDSQGEISRFEFLTATVRSAAKLNYAEVAAHLRGDQQLEHVALNPLKQVLDTLLSRRREKHLVMDDRPDYRLILNDSGKIELIRKVERNDAHRLVEECMLVTNRCAAEFLREQPALFMTHRGVREDRVENIKTLLAEFAPALKDLPFTELKAFIELQQQLAQTQSDRPLRSIISRMLERGEWSVEAKPHHGLGFSCYTNCTSPLRKSMDFMVQRCLHAKLSGQPLPAIDSSWTEQQQEVLQRNRQAVHQVEQMLKCQYLSARSGENFAARIVQVAGGGFTVRLDETGIEGFVDVRSIEGKLSFDPVSLRLSNDKQLFQLDQDVQVTVDKIDDGRHRIFFKLV